MDIDKMIKEMSIEQISEDFTDRAMKNIRRKRKIKDWIFVPIFGVSLVIGIVTGILLFTHKSGPFYVIDNNSIISGIVDEGN